MSEHREEVWIEHSGSTITRMCEEENMEIADEIMEYKRKSTKLQ